MRPLLANTEKCCFPEVGEDTGGIFYSPRGLKTLSWGTEFGHVRAIGRSACVEHRGCF